MGGKPTLETVGQYFGGGSSSWDGSVEGAVQLIVIGTIILVQALDASCIAISSTCGSLDTSFLA